MPTPASQVRRLRLPLVFAGALGLAYAVLYWLAPTGAGPDETPLLRWMLAAALAAAGVVAVRVVQVFVLDVLFVRAQGHRAPALVHAVVAMAMYFVLGLLIAGGVFGQSLTGAIATSAVASVVLGLALQETLGNFFSGIALQIEQPFRLGDVIRAAGYEGRVEAFNWRATTIVTITDARVVIPNSTVAQEAVEVHGRTVATRRVLPIPAPYDLAPQQVTRVLKAAIAGVPGIAARPAPSVRLGSFDDSSIGYEVLYHVEDALRGPAVDAVIRQRVWYAFARNDVAIPFPHEVQVPYEPPAPPVEEDPAAARVRWLGEVGLFGPLSDDERAQLAETAQTLLYGPGETIIRAGEPGGSLFIVVRGLIEVQVPQADGRRVTVAEMGAGEVIGEMSLLTGDPRSADVRAVDEAELLRVGRDDVRGLLADNEALAEAFAREVSDRVARRADVLAEIDDPAAASVATLPLLRRIRRFFDLD